MADKQQQDDKFSQNSRDMANMGKGMNLAIGFMSHVLVATAMGYGIDYFAGTLPLFMLLFMVLGFVAGLRSMWRYANAKPGDEDSRPTPSDAES